MPHLITHLGWWLLAPANLALMALLIAVLLLWTGRARLARAVVTLTAGLLLLIAVLPVSAWLLRPLEDRFPRPRELPEAVAGIITLGGSVDPIVSHARGRPAIGSAVERLTEFLRLARRYPEARLIFSGGTGSVLRPDLKEAPAARRFLESLGLDGARLEVEDRSRNTLENAIYSRELARPGAGDRWILVTSALHMPRSVGVFRAAGWTVIPYPVDYLTAGGEEPALRFDLQSGLSTLTVAAREWIGLAAYRALGRTDTLLPGP